LEAVTSGMVKVADWEELVHYAMNCRVCDIATALELIVVMSCKVEINPTTNPNPDYSHWHMWQYVKVD
jgi:hypothetical protein